MLLAALADRGGAARDIVALNAGASIYVSGLAATLADGVDQAFEGHRLGRGTCQARSVRCFHAAHFGLIYCLAWEIRHGPANA
jgi:anthranilate phosphoribosyltransferase